MLLPQFETKLTFCFEMLSLSFDHNFIISSDSESIILTAVFSAFTLKTTLRGQRRREDKKRKGLTDVGANKNCFSFALFKKKPT
jgi:hypothetical protein